MQRHSLFRQLPEVVLVTTAKNVATSVRNGTQSNHINVLVRDGSKKISKRERERKKEIRALRVPYLDQGKKWSRTAPHTSE